MKITKRGAPTKITSEVEIRLESILKVGGTIAEATTYAGIAERTYYSTAEKNFAFKQKMERAKHYADVVAKKVVVKAIIEDKDLNTAKWWLEKREFRDNRGNININEAKILVMPAELIKKHEISSDTSESSK